MKARVLTTLTALLVALACARAARGQAAPAARDGQADPPPQRQSPDPAAAMRGLRDMFFTLTPEKAGAAAGRSGAYGVMMEMALPGGVASLVSLSTGDASIYVSTGGGVIGGGGFEEVRRAAKAFVAESGKHLRRMTATKTFPQPAAGRVRFYVLTRGGVFTAEAPAEELSRNRHRLSPLFYAGNGVLTQLRLSTEKRQ